MIWLKHLYVGDKAFKKRQKIVRNIRRHKPLLDVYVLMLPLGPTNQLELISANTLLQSYYRKKEDLTIVGIAGGYDDAVMLTMRIVDECVRKTGGADLRAFLEDKIRREGAE